MHIKINIMIHFLIPFQVHTESLSEAKSIIQRFVREVHTKEAGTLLYKSFQHLEQETMFTPVMTFRDEKAHEIHRTSPYLKIFVEGLYPLCTEKPINIRVNEI